MSKCLNGYQCCYFVQVIRFIRVIKAITLLVLLGLLLFFGNSDSPGWLSGPQGMYLGEGPGRHSSQDLGRRVLGGRHPGPSFKDPDVVN